MEKFRSIFEELDVKENMEDIFKEKATELINNFIIVANSKTYRLGEIEFYLFEDGKHNDTFIHAIIKEGKPSNFAANRQCHLGEWYFHYSGIDIAIGDGKNRYGGILIRSLISDKVTNKKDLIGPLKIKNHLLNDYKGIDASEQFIKLKYDPSAEDVTIYPRPRVGLGKSGNNYYRKMNYRFVHEAINNIVKES